MRKLQTIGKASGRARTALSGAGASGERAVGSLELRFQQQPQTTILRPTRFAKLSTFVACQKQNSQASSWRSTTAVSSRSSNSVYSSAPLLVPELWFRHKQDCSIWSAHKSADRSSCGNQADNTGIPSKYRNLSSLPRRNNREISDRIFFKSRGFEAFGFHQHSSAKIPLDRSSYSRSLTHAFWFNGKDFRGYDCECRIRNKPRSSFSLSSSSRKYSEVTCDMGGRDGLVSPRYSSMVMGGNNRRPEPFSAFSESQQQGIEAYAWRLSRLSDVRPMGELFYIFPSESSALFEPPDKRLSKGFRSRSRCQKTWCLGRQRAENRYENLESLPGRTYYAKTDESGHSSNSQQIQGDSKMRSEVKRQIYGCSEQKLEKTMACNLVFHKKPRSSRANKQSGRASLATTCNLAKNFARQQIVEWNDLCSKAYDDFDKSGTTRSRSNEFSRNHAGELQSWASSANTKFSQRCLIKQNQFTHSDAEKQKFLVQMGAYVKKWSRGESTT